MSSTALEPNPMTTIGTGGAGLIYAPPTDDPNYRVDPLQAFGVPTGQGLPTNLQIAPPNPLGAYTDDQFLADDNSLRAQLGQQYSDILKQLGYMDPNTGRVIPGSVVQDANIQLAQHQQSMQEALRANVQQMIENGTLFSGQRVTDLQQRQFPISQNIGQLHLNTSRTLNDLYNQAQNLVTNYNTTNQQNLAQAAARNLAKIQANHLSAPQETSPEGTVLPDNFSLESQGQGPAYAPDPALAAPVGGTYTHGPGVTYYQSNQGNYGKKPLY